MSIYIVAYLESQDLYHVTIESCFHFFDAYMTKEEILQDICSNYSDYL